MTAHKIDLDPYIHEGTVLGTMVKHPFYVGMLLHDGCPWGTREWVEEQIKRREAAYREARGLDDAIWHVERMFRLGVLYEARSEVSTKLLCKVWTDAEFPASNLGVAKCVELFEVVGFTHDHDADPLPSKRVRVYRGASGGGEEPEPCGVSWTTSLHWTSRSGSRSDSHTVTRRVSCSRVGHTATTSSGCSRVAASTRSSSIPTTSLSR